MSAPLEFDDAHDALASEYVLGTLPEDEREYVEAALEHDAQLRAAVAWWEARLAPLAELAEPVTPSDKLWKRISGSIGGRSAKPAFRIRRNLRPAWGDFNFWRGLVSAGVAFAVLFSVVLYVRKPLMPPRYVVVLVAPQSQTQAPGWMVQAAGHDAVKLVPLGMTTVPQGRALEFWTKADDWQAPVSLGLVQPGQAVEIPLDKLPPLVPNQLFELTLEPATGSPVGRPTGPIQFIGRAVRLM